MNGMNFCTTSSCVAEKFTSSGLVPDVISRPPTEILRLEFGSKAVQLGNVFLPTEAADAPTTISWSTKPNELYTVAFS
uniref:Uncharacterized protein n=1 Tax=Plectus sambesii TaxID=2011161 RepID=A0A914WPI0_9BILA